MRARVRERGRERGRERERERKGIKNNCKIGDKKSEQLNWLELASSNTNLPLESPLLDRFGGRNGGRVGCAARPIVPALGSIWPGARREGSRSANVRQLRSESAAVPTRRLSWIRFSCNCKRCFFFVSANWKGLKSILSIAGSFLRIWSTFKFLSFFNSLLVSLFWLFDFWRLSDVHSGGIGRSVSTYPLVRHSRRNSFYRLRWNNNIKVRVTGLQQRSSTTWRVGAQDEHQQSEGGHKLSVNRD